MADPAERELTLDSVLPAATRDALRHLEIFARKTAEGMLHGAHLSRRKGVSTEFDHHKQYMPGDPIKHVDWKVSARHDQYYIKRYIEDTALAVQLVIDNSASLKQTSGGVSVWRQTAHIAASLAYLVVLQRDSIGMVLTNTDDTLWLPASSTQTQLVRILQALSSTPTRAADALDVSLRATLERVSRRGIVAIVSDLMFDPKLVRRDIRKLQARGHEVMIFHVRDPDAETFPFSRWMQFDSLERAGVRHRVDTVSLKRFYLEEYRSFTEEWRAWARKYDVHLVSLRSDDPAETALAEYLALRAEGRAGA